MSGHLAVLPKRAVTDDRIAPAALRTLLAIGSFTNAAGWCRVKQDTLAEMLNVSQQAISRQTNVLVKLGYVEVVRTGRSMRYRVRLDSPADLQPEVVEPDCPIQPEVVAATTSGVVSDSTSGGCSDRTTVSNDVLERTPTPLPPAALPIPHANGVAKATEMGFGEFWQVYPRHEAKRAAQKAWPGAVKRAGGAGPIIIGANRYAEDPNRDPAMTAHPATWLNADRWDDDPLPARGAQGHGPPPLRLSRSQEYFARHPMDPIRGITR